MLKYLLVLALFLISFQAQSKTIIVGSHGGYDVFINLSSYGKFYDPIGAHAGESSGYLGNYDNYDENDPTPAYGVDAAIVYFDENSSESIKSRVYTNVGNPLSAFSYVTGEYNADDRVIVLGFSSGGFHALALTNLLDISGYPVHILGLFDAVANNPALIPNNVEKVALYYQTTESEVNGLAITRSANFASQSNTSYFSGHPKSVSSNNHFTMHFETDVWQDFGQKMVSASSGSNSDDRSNQFSVANYTDVCDYDSDKWWSLLAGYLSAKYDCAGNENSLKGMISWNTTLSQAAFAPYYEPQVADHTVYISESINPVIEFVPTPQECFLNHKDLSVKNYATNQKLDTGLREVQLGTVVKFRKEFEMEDADATECRVKESLKTVETGFYVSLNDGSLDLIRGPDGERYQKTKMSNLDLGDDHSEFVLYTVGGSVGDKLEFVACHDVNEDLNQPERDDCEDEVLTVIAPPIEGEHETVGRDYFRGYAVDHDLPEGGLTINVFVDRTPSSTPDYTTTTTHYLDQERGAHRWYWAVPDVLRDGLSHTYYFEAVNVGPGTDKVLDFNGSPSATYTIAASQGTIVPLYRFYSSLLDCHFYTISESEKDQVANGDQGSHWGIEHTEGWVLSVQEPGSLPVYRFWRNYNVKTNDVGCHFFTNSETERSALLAEKLPNSSSIPAQYRGGDMWKPEGTGGIGFYAYPSPRLGTVWMKRAKRTASNAHFFSIGTAEFNQALAIHSFELEGNAFTAFPALPTPPAPVPQAPAIVKKAKNVQLEIGASSVADRIFDQRNNFVIGEKIYAHVIGDVNVNHTWKLRVIKNGSVVYQDNSPLTVQDVKSDLTISYKPTSTGNYTLEAMVNMGNGFISQKTSTVSVAQAPVVELFPSVTINWWNNFNSSWSTPGVFDIGEDITVMFGGTNNSTSITTFDADLEVYNDLGNYVETKTGSISMPLGSNKDQNGDDPRFTTSLNVTPGNYNTKLCIGTSCTSQKPVTILGGNNPPLDITVNWNNLFKTSDNSWTTPTSFAVGEQLTVMFGGVNNSSTQAVFDAEVRVFSGTTLVETLTGQITMPANSNKDQDGNDPRFTTSFSQAGSFTTRLCIANVCEGPKTRTVY